MIISFKVKVIYSHTDASILGCWGVSTPRFWAGGRGEVAGRLWGSWVVVKYYYLIMKICLENSKFFDPDPRPPRYQTRFTPLLPYISPIRGSKFMKWTSVRTFAIQTINFTAS